MQLIKGAAEFAI